jgi:hypothetical protein
MALTLEKVCGFVFGARLHTVADSDELYEHLVPSVPQAISVSASKKGTVAVETTLGRAQAESVVMEGSIGCFVVRPSSSEIGNLVITARSHGLSSSFIPQ